MDDRIDLKKYLDDAVKNKTPVMRIREELAKKFNIVMTPPIINLSTNYAYSDKEILFMATNFKGIHIELYCNKNDWFEDTKDDDKPLIKYKIFYMDKKGWLKWRMIAK